MNSLLDGKYEIHKDAPVIEFIGASEFSEAMNLVRDNTGRVLDSFLNQHEPDGSGLATRVKGKCRPDISPI